MNWHRLFVFANYTLSTSRTNTGGAFSLLPNGDDLEAEWGPTGGDARHRVGGSVNAQPVANLTVALNANVRTGTPYNVTTGRDDNGDGVFNDRPVGTPRNSTRGAASADLGGRVSYALGFGPRRAAGGGGGTQVVMISGGGGGGPMAPAFGGGPNDRRFRLEFYLSAQNLLNRANFTGYSGVLTSPLFGQPTGASPARRVQVGVRLGF